MRGRCDVTKAKSFGGRLARRLMIATVAITVAVPVYAETLADAMVGAYSHSGLLEQNRALLRAADEDVAIAISALRPVINWSSQASRSFGQTRSASTGGVASGFTSNQASVSLSAELTIVDYGRNRLAIDAAKESVLATRQALISVEQQVLLRAVQAFMEVRRATETVALRQNNVRLITEELRAARDRFEVGEVTRTDVALTEAGLASANANLAVAYGNLEIAKDEYASVVGHNPGQVVPPSRLPKFPASEAVAKKKARQLHPEFLRAQHLVAVSDINVLRAEASMKPTVNLGAGLSVTENFDSTNFTHSGSVSLSASGPIYQGGRLSALVRQAIAQRDSQRGNLHVIRHGLDQNIGTAYARFQVAQAQRDASDRQIRAARVAFRGVREEAALGARTTLEVLNAEQELLDAEAGKISAVADEYVAAYSVLGAMGMLTAKHLNLKVQQYDPAEYYNMIKTAPTVLSKQGRELDRVLRAIGKE